MTILGLDYKKTMRYDKNGVKTLTLKDISDQLYGSPNCPDILPAGVEPSKKAMYAVLKVVIDELFRQVIDEQQVLYFPGFGKFGLYFNRRGRSRYRSPWLKENQPDRVSKYWVTLEHGVKSVTVRLYDDRYRLHKRYRFRAGYKTKQQIRELMRECNANPLKRLKYRLY
jgi:hypothetical protein